MARTETLTWEEARLTRRLRRLLPGWQYRLWTNADQLRLVRGHFPELADRHAAIPFSVARCDIARYVLLHAVGGIYLDTDYKLLRPLDPLLAAEGVLGDEGADPQHGPRDPTYLGLGNALMGSAPGLAFWPALLRHIFEHHRPQDLARAEDVIETTGPEAMSRFYMAYAGEYPQIRVYPRPVFFPPPTRMGLRGATAESYGIHLYWSSWRDKSRSTAFRTQVRRKLNGLLG